MPSFKDRDTKNVVVNSVIFGENIVTFLTNDGNFTVPRTPLTEKISEDAFEYTIEYNKYTHVLTGVISPDGSTLYRINDNQAALMSKNALFLSRIVKDNVEIPLEEVIETMLDLIDPVLAERLKTLPDEYLKEYFAYEVKVSYLASNPPSPLIYDPTPMEQAHALALASAGTSEYPPLILKAS